MKTHDELEKENRNLRLELHTLRFKESQEQRFIWWVREVFAKNVQDTVAGIIEACTYQDEPTAAAGKYGLPIKCFDMMRSLVESTHGIYDGTYLDVGEINTDAKKGIPENKPAYNENANSLLRSAWMIANRNGEHTNWDAFKNAVYKELIAEHEIKTSTDNNKCWWTQESDPEVFPNLWRAGCGNSFYLDAEKPSDNHMKYCCYCGKEIAEGE